MSKSEYTLLENRAVIAVGGEDAAEFLQGLVSNDISRAGPDRALYAALLTPQGKFLFDFFVTELGGQLHLDCEAGRAEAFIKRLTMFKLRSKVTLAIADFTVAAAFGADVQASFGLQAEPGSAMPFAGGVAYVDPRLTDMGVRLVLPFGSAPDALQDLALTAAAPPLIRKIQGNSPVIPTR